MNHEEFIKICMSSRSMREAAKIMGLNFTTFKRLSIKLGCYNPNQNWNKGKSCYDDERINSKHSLFVENSSARRDYIKKLILQNNLIDYNCNECGLKNDWNGKILNLQLDHINGVRNDNRLDNLRFLCPNCHSQTQTWCSKNTSLTINNIEKDHLENTIRDSINVSEVMRKLGLRDSKSNRNQIRIFIESNDLHFVEKIREPYQNKIEKKSKCSCGEIIQRKSKLCIKCKNILSRKVERPELNLLFKEVNELGFTKTARKYGVSDNCIRKWIKSKK